MINNIKNIIRGVYLRLWSKYQWSKNIPIEYISNGNEMKPAHLNKGNIPIGRDGFRMQKLKGNFHYKIDQLYYEKWSGCIKRNTYIFGGKANNVQE